jgi:hypothetical protein
MGHRIIGDEKPHEEALQQMRENAQGGEWYAYQNADMGSAELGHLRFLKVGPDCTLKTAPKRYPDISGPNGCIGWRYGLVGKVNLESGEVEDLPVVAQAESVDNPKGWDKVEPGPEQGV